MPYDCSRQRESFRRERVKENMFLVSTTEFFFILIFHDGSNFRIIKFLR